VNNDDVTLLSAYLDDELSPDERSDIEARLAEDEAFSDLFVNMGQLNNVILSKYSTMDDKALPAELEALLTKSSDNTTPLNLQKSGMRRFMPLAAAIATVAIAIPLYLNQLNNTAGTVEYALNTSPSGQELELADESVMIIQMSFENNQTQLCREYILKKPESAKVSEQIISCKTDSGWHTMVVAKIAQANITGFQTASGHSADAIESWLDTNMSSDAYTLAQEKLILSSQD